MRNTKKILGVGRVVLDHVVVLPAYPDCDTKCLVTDHWRQLGGPVPIALSTASHFGLQTTFLGSWGQDQAGSYIADELGRRGIDISCCVTAGSSGFAQIWTEQHTGKRTIAAYPGAELSRSSCEAAVPILQMSHILHLDGSSASVAVHLAQLMKQQGGMVVLDAGSKKPGMDELFPLLDVLVASDLFCKSWFGTIEVPPGDLLALGCRSVVRTLGHRGATYFDGNTEFHEQALEVQPVDTNGAGDIFCGALLRGLAEDWGMRRTLKFANSVAGYACRFQGNKTLPDPAIVTGNWI